MRVRVVGKQRRSTGLWAMWRRDEFLRVIDSRVTLWSVLRRRAGGE